MNPGALATSNRRDLGDLVLAVFGQWRASGVEFLVLRNYENLPAETGNDIDVLVAPEQMTKAERILINAAQGVGYRLHNRAEFSPISLFFHHTETQQQIQFDLFAHLKWRGLVLLPTGGVLQQGIDRTLFTAPHPIHEAILNLVTRLIYHGYVKDKYKPGILAAFQANPTEATAQLANSFGCKLAAELVAAVLAGDWARVEGYYAQLRWQLIWRQVLFCPWQTVGSLLGDLRRLTGRFLHPPGLTVVLAGADGCGKSTVAEQVVVALRGTFHENKSLRVHWKPVVFFRKRRTARPPSTDPHGKPPRGKLRSALLLGYHWAEFFAGYWTQLRPVLFRNGLVLVDRYHYDFVVDPRRFRLSALPGLARRLFQLLPAPDLVFLLDAPPEVLQSRKREVPIAETARQQKAYRAELGRLPNAQITDATQSAEAVAGEIVRHTLAYMTAREVARGNTHEA